MLENTHQATPSKKLRYSAEGSTFALIYFKNLVLTVLTLGLYYPWARVAVLKYQHRATYLGDKTFDFHGIPSTIFKSYAKLYLLIVLLYSVLFFGLLSQNDLTSAICLGSFYLLLVLLLPFVLHGIVQYRSKNTSWKGITLQYLGSKYELFWAVLQGVLITLLTLGIYAPWFHTKIRKYLISHLRFGNLSFDFKGTGETLFWIQLKCILFLIPSLGIYSFWYLRNLLNFYVENIEITQDGKKVALKFDIQMGDLFQLIIINVVLRMITLGIATPWIMTRNLQFFSKHLVIEGIELSEIQQVTYSTPQTGAQATDFLHFDLA